MKREHVEKKYSDSAYIAFIHDSGNVTTRRVGTYSSWGITQKHTVMALVGLFSTDKKALDLVYEQYTAEMPVQQFPSLEEAIGEYSSESDNFLIVVYRGEG